MGLIKLSIQDEQDLGWYFGPGQSCFERSTFGVVLERQRALACHEARCRSCKGTGFKGGTSAKSARDEYSTLNVLFTETEMQALRAKLDDLDSQCPSCRGSGAVLSHKSGGNHSQTSSYRCKRCKGAAGKLDCPDCRGAGYVECNPVRVASSSRGESGYEVDGATQERYSRVSRQLQSIGPINASVLQAYYGDIGARWQSRPGRIFAVYPLTAAGKNILGMPPPKMDDGQDAETLSPDRRIKIQYDLEALQAGGERSWLLRCAEAQARMMHSTALEAWLECK